mgnify:CR=1 FL=1
MKRDGINLMQLYAPVPCESELAYNELLKERIREVAEAASSDEAAVLSLHEVEACQTLLEVSLCSRPHHTVPRHGDQKIDAESGSVTRRYVTAHPLKRVIIPWGLE